MTLLGSFMELRNYFKANVKSDHFELTRAKLIINFLTGGIVTNSEPGTVFNTPDDEKRFLRAMREIITILLVDINIEFDCEIKESLTIIRAASTKEKLARINNLLPQVAELESIVLPWGFTIENMFSWIRARDLGIIETIIGPFYSLRIILAQLSICFNLSQRMNEMNFAEHANRYLLSLVICGDPTKNVHPALRKNIPVISDCVIQSLESPEFDCYKFLTVGPPALFYNSVYMLDEMEYVFSMPMVSSWGNFRRLKRQYQHSNDPWWKVQRRIDVVMCVNNIPKRLPQESKYNILIKKFGNNVACPIVTYARRI